MILSLQSMKTTKTLIVVLCVCLAVLIFLNTRSNTIDIRAKLKESFNGVPRVESGDSKNIQVTNVMFLKTHKTGGSTLQNILFRKAYNSNLLVGLPKKGGNLFLGNKGEAFRRSMVLPTPPNREINMMISHMIFNHEEVSAVMNSKTTYITLLREPGKRFESAFNYLYDRVPAFKHAKGEKLLIDYLENAQEYYLNTKSQGGLWWHGRNGIFYEFGYDNMNVSDEYIANAIKEIDDIFDLVLLVEYFDVSLILLMDLLNWEMEDMIYLVMNARKSSTVEKIDAHTQNLIYDWNTADVAMYKYFNNTLWRRVEKYGKEKMTENLKKLQKMKEDATKFCIEKVMDKNQKLPTSSKKIRVLEQYMLKTEAKQNATCVGMTTAEAAWHKRMLTSQYQEKNKIK